jgi:hypothetical protein
MVGNIGFLNSALWANSYETNELSETFIKRDMDVLSCGFSVLFLLGQEHTAPELRVQSTAVASGKI